MIKILSWKINSGVYAYIYPVNDGKYISNRIPEDSPIWIDIIEIMSKWDKNAYKTNFDAMNREIESKYGKTIEWDDKYWDFTDENYSNGIDIVLLSGKDGVSVAGEGEKTDGDSGNIDEFIQEIENKLNEAREEIEKKNEEVENFIEEKVSQTISNAQKTIDKTKEELNAVREELTEGLNSAKDALKKASELFDFNGEISQDDIIEAVSTTKEYGEWLESYSEDLTSLKSDYDATAKAMGSIGEAEDVSKGLFSKMATSISIVSGTVGTVESTMNASLGEIKDMASWYDTNKDDATEAIRLISASGAQIQDTVNFINGEGLTTHLNTIMDAKNANLKQEILAETDEHIGNVRREMNAISGSIEDTIVRLSDETLTSMGDRMNAMDSEMEKWLTRFDELCGTTIDLRDTWTLESGKLSSIASLIPETDEYGNILYYVSSVTLSDNSIQTIPELEVVRVETDNIGSYLYMVKNKDEAGDLRDYIWKEAYMKLSSQMTSYIQQEVSSITFSIVNDEGLTAAIKLAITGSTEGDEEPIITMIAKEVVISADLIAGAISAVSANIGGIEIGNGIIKSSNNTANQFMLNGKDGTITANNVSLSGSVYATNGVFSGSVYATDGVFSGSVCATNGVFSGSVYATDGVFSGSINATTGKIGGLNINENYLSYSGTIINSGDEEFKDENNKNIALACSYSSTLKPIRHIDKGIPLYINVYDLHALKPTPKIYSINANDGNSYYCEIEKNKDYRISYTAKIAGTTPTGLTINGAKNGDYNGVYEIRPGLQNIKLTDISPLPINFFVNDCGDMFCNEAYINNAYIKSGEINAIGTFQGELKDAYGDIKKCNIDSASISNMSSKSLYFNYTNYLTIPPKASTVITPSSTSSGNTAVMPSVYDLNKCFFKIDALDTTNISANTITPITVEISSIIICEENTSRTEIVSFKNDKLQFFTYTATTDCDIHIPSIYFAIKRWNPPTQYGSPSSSGNTLTIRKNNNNIDNCTLNLSNYTNGIQQEEITLNETVINNVKSGDTIEIYLKYDIGLERPINGPSKFEIHIEPKKNNVIVTPKTKNNTSYFNTFINRNGVIMELSGGTSIIINNDGIYLDNLKLNIAKMKELGILS